MTQFDELLLNIFSKRRNPGCLAIQLYVENRVDCAVLREDRLVCEALKFAAPLRMIAHRQVSQSKSHAFFESPINRPFLGSRFPAITC